MIIISYSKEDKNTAKKLLSKLETQGYKCWIDPRDVKGENKKEAISSAIKETELMILLFSENSNNTEDIVEQYDLAFEEEVPIIPFVISDLKMSVTTQHFFNTHDWINAFDASFTEASENLIDLMESEEADTSYEQKEARPRRNTNSKEKTVVNSNNQKYIIGGIAAVFAIVLIAILLWQPSEKTDKNLVGSWFLTNYEDNSPRTTPQEISNFQGQVTFLKQNFALTLNKDNTFERRGFGEKPDYGSWEVISVKGQDYLKIKPLNQEDGDALMMREFTENKLVLSIATNIDSVQVITTLTLRKN